MDCFLEGLRRVQHQLTGTVCGLGRLRVNMRRNHVEHNESGLPPKADSDASISDVAKGPRGDSCTAAKLMSSFDHLVGTREQGRWQVEADGLTRRLVRRSYRLTTGSS